MIRRREKAKLTILSLLWGRARVESDLFDAPQFQDPLEPHKNGVELGKDQDCFSLMPIDDAEEDPLFLRELVGLVGWIKLLNLPLQIMSRQVL